VPSNALQRAAVLEAVGACEGELVELGAGWGTLAFALADRFPRARVTAYELSWVPFAVMRLRQALRPRANLTLRRADFLRAPLGDAEVLVSYLFRGGMEALKAKLEAEGRPGARLVTHTFGVRGWTASSERDLGDLFRTRVFVYPLPADRQGAVG
jgi:hypothetical protein